MKKRWIFSLLMITAWVFGDPPPDPTSVPPGRLCHGYSHLFLTGDFIYWKARQEELNQIGTLILAQAATERNVSIKAKDIHFEYSPGFKLGLGGNLPYDDWDVYVNWTHLRNNPKTTYRSTNHDLIDVERLGTGGGIPFVSNQAMVEFDVMFNSIDFDWGRRYFISDSWSVRPSFGGKAFWIYQKIRYDFENTQTIPLPNIGTIPGVSEFLHAKNDYWGIGPYFAFEGKWSFGWGIGLLGKLSGAIVWGKFEQNARSNENELSFDGGTPTLILSSVRQDTEAHRVRPTAQMFIGLDWEWCFIPDRLGAQIRAGYETQFFWGQLLNVRSVEESEFSLEGLTLMGRLDF